MIPPASHLTDDFPASDLARVACPECLGAAGFQLSRPLCWFLCYQLIKEADVSVIHKGYAEPLSIYV